MARSMYTDGVVAIMHFNSSTNAYLHARRSSYITVECCHCYQELELNSAPKPGQPMPARCPTCGKKVVFRAEGMSRAAAQHFDVRTSALEGRQLLEGGVVLTLLPELHPEFQGLMAYLSSGKSLKYSVPDMLGYIQKDFATRVVNSAIEVFEARARAVRGPQPWGENAQVQLVSCGFDRFEHLIAPRPVEYPERAKSRVLELAQPATEDLVEHLLHLASNFSDYERVQRYVAVIGIERVLDKWSGAISDIVGPSLDSLPDAGTDKSIAGSPEPRVTRQGLLSRILRGTRMAQTPTAPHRTGAQRDPRQNTVQPSASSVTSSMSARPIHNANPDMCVWDGNYDMQLEADRDLFVWDNWEGLSSLAYNCYEAHGRGILIITGSKTGPKNPLPYLGMKGVQEAIREGLAGPQLEKRVRDYDPATTMLVIFDLPGIGRMFEAYTEDMPGQRPRDLWRRNYRK